MSNWRGKPQFGSGLCENAKEFSVSELEDGIQRAVRKYSNLWNRRMAQMFHLFSKYWNSADRRLSESEAVQVNIDLAGTSQYVQVMGDRTISD
jgi:hypothetical protein